jgi:hypothetical protein
MATTPRRDDTRQVSWWRSLLSQYLVPAAVASVIAAGVSIYNAVNAQRDKDRTFNTSFETLVTNSAVMGAFKGSDTDEQKAASQLLALQAVADTSAHRRTVLLLAARLLNANTDSDATGGAAARLLNILIAEDLRGDKQLHALIHSQQFIDLVTAGYTNDYYNDDLRRDWYTWSTFNGDQPITHDAKLAVLTQLSPSNFEGWVHVATFSSEYHYPNQTHATPVPGATPAVVQSETVQAPIGSRTAQSFLEAINEVNRDHSTQRAKDLLAQYAIAPVSPHTPDPSASGAAPASGTAARTPAPLPLLRKNDLLEDRALPVKLVMLKPRLLRNRAPLEFVNPDGSFHKGSLGTIIGALPAGTCIDVIEQLHPVLVFVTAPMAARISGAKNDEWTGLIHMWAHVRLSQGCGSVSVSPHTT